jgi:hypothetical protein
MSKVQLALTTRGAGTFYDLQNACFSLYYWMNIEDLENLLIDKKIDKKTLVILLLLQLKEIWL